MLIAIEIILLFHSITSTFGRLLSFGILSPPGIPSLPNLISQFLINQQGFDIDACEHGQRMACS
jgi:hypothetical protein